MPIEKEDRQVLANASVQGDGEARLWTRLHAIMRSFNLILSLSSLVSP